MPRFKSQILHKIQISDFSETIYRCSKKIHDGPGMFARAAVTRYYRLGDLNNRNWFFAQFCRLAVHDQGVSRLGFFREASSSPTDGHFLVVFSHGHLSHCVCIRISLYYISYILLYYFSYIALEPTLIPCLNVLTPNIVPSWGADGIRTSTYEIGENTVQLITVPIITIDNFWGIEVCYQLHHNDHCSLLSTWMWGSVSVGVYHWNGLFIYIQCIFLENIWILQRSFRIPFASFWILALSLPLRKPWESC